MISTVQRGGVVLLTALVLAACGGGRSASAPPSSPAVSPVAPAVPSPTIATSTGPPPLTAEEVNDFGKLCGTHRHQATPSQVFTGPGPHPIVVFGKDADSDEYERDYLVNRKGKEFDPKSPDEVALLACITGAKAGKRVGDCRYKTGRGVKSVRVDAQRFTIEIFALDTGTRVARKTFTADFCPPGLISVNGGADIPNRMYSTMTIDDRAKIVEPYVRAAA